VGNIVDDGVQHWYDFGPSPKKREVDSPVPATRRLEVGLPVDLVGNATMLAQKTAGVGPEPPGSCLHQLMGERWVTVSKGSRGIFSVRAHRVQ
jgi:hypothetical protein